MARGKAAGRGQAEHELEEVTCCPLCIEPLDETEKEFYPCACGYQICLFCYGKLKNEYNSLCPGCRTPYNEKGVSKAEVKRHNSNANANPAPRHAARKQGQAAGVFQPEPAIHPPPPPPPPRHAAAAPSPQPALAGAAVPLSHPLPAAGPSHRPAPHPDSATSSQELPKGLGAPVAWGAKPPPAQDLIRTASSTSSLGPAPPDHHQLPSHLQDEASPAWPTLAASTATPPKPPRSLDHANSLRSRPSATNSLLSSLSPSGSQGDLLGAGTAADVPAPSNQHDLANGPSARAWAGAAAEPSTRTEWQTRDIPWMANGEAPPNVDPQGYALLKSMQQAVITGRMTGAEAAKELVAFLRCREQQAGRLRFSAAGPGPSGSGAAARAPPPGFAAPAADPTLAAWIPGAGPGPSGQQQQPAGHVPLGGGGSFAGFGGKPNGSWRGGHERGIGELAASMGSTAADALLWEGLGMDAPLGVSSSAQPQQRQRLPLYARGGPAAAAMADGAGDEGGGQQQQPQHRDRHPPGFSAIFDAGAGPRQAPYQPILGQAANDLHRLSLGQGQGNGSDWPANR